MLPCSIELTGTDSIPDISSYLEHTGGIECSSRIIVIYSNSNDVGFVQSIRPFSTVQHNKFIRGSFVSLVHSCSSTLL